MPASRSRATPSVPPVSHSPAIGGTSPPLPHGNHGCWEQWQGGVWHVVWSLSGDWGRRTSPAMTQRLQPQVQRGPSVGDSDGDSVAGHFYLEIY